MSEEITYCQPKGDPCREKPILFSGPLVRAILAGTKTQTRRVVKPQPDSHFEVYKDSAGAWVCCDNSPPDVADVWRLKNPYGKPGGQLWVREAHGFVMGYCGYCRGAGGSHNPLTGAWDPYCYTCEGTGGEVGEVVYRADGNKAVGQDGEPPEKWRPSIHMPRWASRINLLVAGMRVERVQDISWQDALAEGIEPAPCEPHHTNEYGGCTDCMGTGIGENPVHAFEHLWDSINEKRGFGWELNPWVWVVEFKVTP